MTYILRIAGLLICALFTYLAMNEMKYVNEKKPTGIKVYLYVLMIVLGLVMFVMSRIYI